MPSPQINHSMPIVKTVLKQFFNRDAIMAKIPAIERKALAQSGAYVMTTARNLIKSVGSAVAKQRKKFDEGKITSEKLQQRIAKIVAPSPPGSPPKSRMGPLKDLLLFAYDESTGHVVVGPAKLPKTPSNPTVPELLEHGGEFAGTQLEPTGEWYTEGGEHHQYLRRKPAIKHMAQRAYMGEPSGAMSKPAVKSKLVKIYQDSLQA